MRTLTRAAWWERGGENPTGRGLDRLGGEKYRTARHETSLILNSGVKGWKQKCAIYLKGHGMIKEENLMS